MNEILYQNIMQNISKGLKETLNEGFIDNDLYYKSDKIIRQLKKAFIDNPEINIHYPESRSIAAKITFKDPKILIILNHNYEANNLRIEIDPDLTAYIVYDYNYHRSNDSKRTEIPELSSKSIKQLITKLDTMSFFQPYKEQYDEHSSINDDEINNIEQSEEIKKLVKKIYKQHKDLDFRLRQLFTPELYEIFKFDDETWIYDFVDDEYYDSIQNISLFTTLETDIDKVINYLTFISKHKSLGIATHQEIYIDYESLNDDMETLCDSLVCEYEEYISNIYETNDMGDGNSYTSLSVYTKNDKLEIGIKQILDIYNKYVEFMENNFDRIYDETMNNN